MIITSPKCATVLLFHYFNHWSLYAFQPCCQVLQPQPQCHHMLRDCLLRMGNQLVTSQVKVKVRNIWMKVMGTRVYPRMTRRRMVWTSRIHTICILGTFEINFHTNDKWPKIIVNKLIFVFFYLLDVIVPLELREDRSEQGQNQGKIVLEINIRVVFITGIFVIRPTVDWLFLHSNWVYAYH